MEIKKNLFLCFLTFFEDGNNPRITDITTKNIISAIFLYNQPKIKWRVVFLCLPRSFTILFFAIHINYSHLHTVDSPSFLFSMSKIMIKRVVKVTVTQLSAGITVTFISNELDNSTISICQIKNGSPHVVVGPSILLFTEYDIDERRCKYVFKLYE